MFLITWIVWLLVWREQPGENMLDSHLLGREFKPIETTTTTKNTHSNV